MCCVVLLVYLCCVFVDLCCVSCCVVLLVDLCCVVLCVVGRFFCVGLVSGPEEFYAAGVSECIVKPR